MKKEIKKESFYNPLEKGTDYESFLKQKGDQTIEEYCKGNLTDEEIDYIKREIKLLNQK